MSTPEEREYARAWHQVLIHDPCVWCGRTPAETLSELGFKLNRHGTAMTIEHLIPKRAGGRRYAWDNAVAACWGCNHKRGETPLLFFLWQVDQQRRRWAPGRYNAYWRAKKVNRRLRRLLYPEILAAVDAVWPMPESVQQSLKEPRRTGATSYRPPKKVAVRAGVEPARV